MLRVQGVWFEVLGLWAHCGRQGDVCLVQVSVHPAVMTMGHPLQAVVLKILGRSMLKV